MTAVSDSSPLISLAAISYRELKGRVADLYAVGDCVAPRGVHQAILDATRAARQL